jgi:hypothetical protein
LSPPALPMNKPPTILGSHLSPLQPRTESGIGRRSLNSPCTPESPLAFSL